MKITKDNFVWLILTSAIAEDIFRRLKAIDLYILRDDDSEELIETMGDLYDAISIGFDIGIEVGRLPKEVIAKKGRKVHQATFNSEIYTSMRAAKNAICEAYNFDKESYKPIQIIKNMEGAEVTTFPFNQKVITRILK